jgi:hypothetical protein
MSVTWAVHDLARRQRLERGLPQLLPLGLEQGAARQHDVGPALVELDDLEVELLAHDVLEVPHGTQVDLRTRQERLDADVHRETALDAGDDDALDGLVRLVGAADLVPDLEPVRLLLGEHDAAVLVLRLLEEHVDFVADADEDGAVVVHELPGGHEPLGLEADVDLDVVFVDGEHGAADDLAFLDGPYALFEQLGEAAADRLCGYVTHESYSDLPLGSLLSRSGTESADASRMRNAGKHIGRATRPAPRHRRGAGPDGTQPGADRSHAARPADHVPTGGPACEKRLRAPPHDPLSRSRRRALTRRSFSSGSPTLIRAWSGIPKPASGRMMTPSRIRRPGRSAPVRASTKFASVGQTSMSSARSSRLR